MPFLMIRNDITKVAADAIVNPANRNLLQGSGTSRAIYQAAGEQEMTAACEAIGRCDLGRAVCTLAFGLSAKYVFHAVCPAWHGGGFGEAEQLAGAYHSALELAAEYHCESVAFPLLSSGNYGYPKEQAFRDAVKEAARFGISSDRAVRFENDAQGVAVNYRVVSETVSRMREAPYCASIGAEWKEQIEADFQKRHHR